jgi:hypothetical protein
MYSFFARVSHPDIIIIIIIINIIIIIIIISVSRWIFLQTCVYTELRKKYIIIIINAN